MTQKALFIIDPLEQIKYEKDTSFALMLEAQKRGFEVYICQQTELYFFENKAMGSISKATATEQPIAKINPIESMPMELSEFKLIFMRKDPPFDINYVYTTYLLEHAEKSGCLVINKPQSLRDCSEKYYTTHFPELTPPFIISADLKLLADFVSKHGKCILKPLDAMGGKQIYLSFSKDPNLTCILEALTHYGTTPIMVQIFISAIKKGDKRIMLLNGKPFKYGLLRVPPKHAVRGNLVAGGQGVGCDLNKKDLQICEQVGPALNEKGILFAGIDVIGDYLTEINVTSPTCVREIDQAFETNVCAEFFEGLPI